MLAFKLLRVRKNGTLGSLFIGRRAVIQQGVWMEAKPIRTKGYAFRPGFHVLPRPVAPHLSNRGRQWFRVEIEDYTALPRPESQGGCWFLARRMKVLSPVDPG